ncbi:MAG: hypothetical protein AAFQ54_10220 [Pseudomonadota bacterium]
MRIWLIGVCAILAVAFALLARERPCAEANVDCLVDEALAALPAATRPQRINQIAAQLAFLGRAKAARSVVAEDYSWQSDASRRSRFSLLWAVETWRALQDGTPLEAQITGNPPPDALALVHLSGLLTSGPAYAGLRPAPAQLPESDRRAARAALALSMSEGAGPVSAQTRLEAAKVFAELGHADRAFALLEAVYAEGGEGTQISVMRISAETMQAIGVARVLEVIERAGKTSVFALLNAARAAPTPEARESYLTRAFRMARDDGPWPDRDHLTRVVGAALDVGEPDLALRFARDFDIAARTRVTFLPSDMHLAAAAALQETGAPAPEVRAALARALESFGNRRLSVDSAVPLATLLVKLGDVDTALLRLKVTRDANAWERVLSEPLPQKARDRITAQAARGLGAEALRDIELRLAIRAPEPMRTALQSKVLPWAGETMESWRGRDALRRLPQVATLAARAGDAELETRAEALFAEAALRRGAPRDLMQAAWRLSQD